MCSFEVVAAACITQWLDINMCDISFVLMKRCDLVWINIKSDHSITDLDESDTQWQSHIAEPHDSDHSGALVNLCE